jgi:WD40 repeat protein
MSARALLAGLFASAVAAGALSAPVPVRRHPPLPYTFRGHANVVRSVAFHPRDWIIASGSADATVRLWDVASRKSIKVLTGHREPVDCVAFSPDNNFVASGSYDDTSRLWDVSHGK